MLAHVVKPRTFTSSGYSIVLKRDVAKKKKIDVIVTDKIDKVGERGEIISGLKHFFFCFLLFLRYA